MPSTTSSWVSRLLASSTVMTPSFPTFSIASAIKSPMLRPPLADTRPPWAISALLLVDLESFFSSSTTAATALSTPRLRLIGSWPAATSLAPSVKRARASTVAVVVPSPATSEVFEATSFTICTPMFSNLSSSSISFATVTPSLVMFGAPNDFSRTTLRPRGPSVTVTASARTFTPRRILSRASWLNFTSCAAVDFSSSALGHAEDVLLAHDQMLFAVDLDLGAGVLAEQHGVAHHDVERGDLAVVADLSLAGGNDLALLGFFLGGVGDDDAPFGLLDLLLETLDDHPVLQRPDLHADGSFRGRNGEGIAGGANTNHGVPAVKEVGGSPPELSPLLLVVPAVEDVPLPAPGEDALRHPPPRQLIEALVEREALGEDALRLGEEQPLAAHAAEPFRADSLQDGVRQEGQSALRQVQRTNPRRSAIRCLTSCSTRRRSRSSRRMPGAPRRTTRSASAAASRSISASSSKLRARSAAKQACTFSSGTSSARTSAATSRFVSSSATRCSCAGDGRMAPCFRRRPALLQV